MPAHASTTFGGWRVPRRRWLGRRLEDQRCSCWLGCGSVGRYFGCPLGINGATGKRRGDEIAQIRGHKIYMGEGGQEVFGEELPSPPESPLADHEFHDAEAEAAWAEAEAWWHVGCPAADRKIEL